jgi:uncharacterized protein (TIGR03067 family)
MMIRLMTTLVLCVTVLAAPLAGQDPKVKPKTEKDRLQGNWQATQIVIAGIISPKADAAGTQMLIKGDELAYTIADSKKAARGSAAAEQFDFTFDASRAPKSINFTPHDGVWKGKTTIGIYELEGDKLTLCFHDRPGDERPKEMKSPRNSLLVVMKMRRMKE